MIVYMCIKHKLIVYQFEDYPWYDKLIVFFTEIGPVLIIFYGLFIFSDTKKQERMESSQQNYSTDLESDEFDAITRMSGTEAGH